MALDSPQLTSFCNQNLRKIGNKLNELNILMDEAISIYNARNLGTVITDGGPGEVIQDGSAQDGRTLCVGGDVWNLLTLMQNYKADFMNDGRKDVISKWKTNE